MLGGAGAMCGTRGDVGGRRTRCRGERAGGSGEGRKMLRGQSGSVDDRSIHLVYLKLEFQQILQYVGGSHELSDPIWMLSRCARDVGG